MFRTKFDGNLISDGFFQSRNVGRSAVAAIYYCMKRNVALKIGPMTSLLEGTMTSYAILRNSTTTLATYDNNQLSYD